jgi:FkbM family methyltransferase
MEGSGWRPSDLRKRGFAPATLIDVGAAKGTPPIYRAFPDAYRVLIEPLREFEDQMQQWISDGQGEHLCTAVGDQEGEASMYIDRERPFMSSLHHRETAPQSKPPELRTVPTTTLDILLEEHRWRPPFGVKIDAEGYEDRVIRGASRLLEDTQFVIADVSVMRRFDGSYSFAEFIQLMIERGFAVYDVVDGAKFEGGQLEYLDLLFRRTEGDGRQIRG